MKLRRYWTSTIYSKLVARRLGRQTQRLDDRGAELGLTADLAYLVVTLPEWEETYHYVWQTLLRHLWHKLVPVVRYPESLAALKSLTLAWHIEYFWEGLNEYDEDPDEILGPLPKGFIVTIPPPPNRRAIAAEHALACAKALIFIVLATISDVLGRVGELIAHLLGQVLLLLITAPNVRKQVLSWGLSPPPPPPLLIIPSTISPAAP